MQELRAAHWSQVQQPTERGFNSVIWILGWRGSMNVGGWEEIEGFCGLQENEPDIYNAIKFGTILENVVFDEETRSVDYDSK